LRSIDFFPPAPFGLAASARWVRKKWVSGEDPDCLFSICDLELDAGIQADFVLVTDGYDGGRTYTLVEVTPPAATINHGNGRRLTGLESARERVRRWQKWIVENASPAFDLLPAAVGWYSNGMPAIRFCVIAGRKQENLRNDHLGSDDFFGSEGAEVIAFDTLAEWMAGYPLCSFFNPGPSFSNSSFSGEGSGLKGDLKMLNQAANPFLPALTGAQWRECLRSDLSRRRPLAPLFLKEVLQRLQPHQGLMEQFDQLASMVDVDDARQLLVDDFRRL